MKTIKIKDIDVFKLLNHGKKRTESIANSALKNVIVPFPGFDSTNFNENMWSESKSQKYGNSYILYIHTLRVCAELMNHYEKTEEIEYFNKSEEIILSWIDYSKKEDVHKMVWYDHTTANRTQVIIQYLYLAQQLERDINYDMFDELLHKHGDVMVDDNIYNHNNHGLMMDRSLMILGNILNDDLYKEKGKSRAVNTFWYSFSPQGIHLENSPQYHNMVVRMYTDIEKYLNHRDDSLGVTVKEYLKLAKKYPSYISRPDKRLANIGDSGSELQRVPKRYKNIYDITAGITIIQHAKPVPFFLTFICGYSSRVHKHKDDLSITLNYNNEDFFVDPGKYSYTRNKTRKYITSREAHSGYYMTEFDYTIKNENRFTRKISLENYYENDTFTIVKGYNNDYDGSSAKLTRHVIQFKNQPLFILVDNLETDRKHDLKLTQKFNLASNVTVQNDDIKKLTVNDTTLNLKQFNEISAFEIIEGDKEKPVAVNTSGFAKVEETKQLKFENATNKMNAFLTAVYDEISINNLNLKLKNSILEVQFNEKEFHIYI
ncbi:heparinase II/III domain-containing protein [Lacicoccus qingdaonensis]|uniref:Heparinase II/III-like protein n=1 Tax=Lacicoccus qingdaonensis TaxID=576118 RepID=A0A1G9IIP1_9BACL|nr:heparinase II/III family protein [Salinicoccus qingdaonensis]SDL25088.1 Heparinase II/III-like protein [Salinicoccus qingdaonensis]